MIHASHKRKRGYLSVDRVHRAVLADKGNDRFQIFLDWLEWKGSEAVFQMRQSPAGEVQKYQGRVDMIEEILEDIHHFQNVLPVPEEEAHTTYKVPQ